MTDRPEVDEFEEWLNQHMLLGGSDVPGRLVVLMGLLERLRAEPMLDASVHTTQNGMQLEQHNQFVDKSLKRHGIDSPLTERGRRSSNLQAWLGSIFGWLGQRGFQSLDDAKRSDLLDDLGALAAKRLEIINQGKPLIARMNKGTAVAVIEDLLDQAQEKNRAKDVAEYLIGAKLQLKFGDSIVTPKNVNTPNRDEHADFRINNAAIEVTISKGDKRHIEQLAKILQNTRLDIWLLVRRLDRQTWQSLVEVEFREIASRRIVVADIETFLGQNTTEMGEFKSQETTETLYKLFELYNQRWLPAAGGAGLRIVVPDMPTGE